MRRNRDDEPERVLCAAIYVDTGRKEAPQQSYAYPETGLVFAGWRHNDCFSTLNAWRSGLSEEEVERIEAIFPHQLLRGRRQGFLTSKGRFVTRAEGGAIAKAAGQVGPDHPGDFLTSECVY